jgi:hypothetical protein
VTEARKYRVKTRLNTLAFDGKGLMARDALMQAEAGVESMREALEETLADSVREIVEVFGPGAPDREGQDPMSLYVFGLAVIDACAIAPESGLDKVAHSLCTLADSFGSSERWDWQAVDVHIATLQLLHSDRTLSAAARNTVLAGLAEVNRRRAVSQDHSEA